MSVCVAQNECYLCDAWIKCQPRAWVHQLPLLHSMSDSSEPGSSAAPTLSRTVSASSSMVRSAVSVSLLCFQNDVKRQDDSSSVSESESEPEREDDRDNMGG